MRPRYFNGCAGGGQVHGYAHYTVVHAFRNAVEFYVEPNFNAFLFEYLLHRGRRLHVFPPDEPRTGFENRHLAAETTVHLAELQSNVAPTQDHKMARQEINLHHRGVGQIFDLVEAWNGR